ncbi:hypothetical protein IH922_07805 [candidate division KSB1 bacterium]|nr:hypothetical protein [candidate division KSB1 bacterium]
MPVSPPDRHGYCSFGPGVFFSPAFCRNSATVIAEVHENFIRTGGDNFVHISQLDRICEAAQATGALPAPPLSEEETMVAEVVCTLVAAELVNDRDTVQIGIGTVASVMAMSPKYIVFDEPTSLLDLASRKALLSLISEFHKKNQTAENNCQISTIFITQYPEETLTFDRLLVLNQGQIVLDDKPAVIFQKVEELKNLGLEVPAEFEVNHYLKKLSDGKLSLNTSDFLPIP